MFVNLNYTWNASKPDIDDLQYCEKTYGASFCDGQVPLQPRLVPFTTWSKPLGGTQCTCFEAITRLFDVF